VIFEKKQTVDLREIRRMLWRRRVVILLPLIIAVGAGIGGIILSEPQYASTATLALETPVPMTRTVAQATGVGGRPTDDGIRILRKRIQSSSFLESVAVQIGLHESPRLVAKAKRLARENPDHDEKDLLLRECVRALNRMLDIRAEGYDIFYVRAVSNSADLAYAVANTVADQYMQSTQRGRLRQSEEAYKFAQEQVAIYETKLEEKRQQLRDFEQRMALRGIEGSPVNTANVSRVNTLIAGAEADLEFLRGRHETVKLRIDEAGLEAFLALGLMKSSKLEALKATLFELERHLALTLIEYQETDQAVQSAKNQIAVKSQQLLTELESLAALAFPSVVAEYRQLLVDYEYTLLSLDAAARRRDEMREFLARYAQDLANMPADEFRLARLREEVASAERLYQTWLEQANSTQIAKAVQSASVGNQIVLIEPAQLPIAPFAPDNKRILALALAMGLALGVGAAVLMEYLDLTLKSVDEIELVLGVPILGAVPRMQAAVIEDHLARRRRRIRVLVPSLGFTALALAALAYWYFFLQTGGVG
jgi:uncharacterized protein involved in exopolysaccharide biosynthesis